MKTSELVEPAISNRIRSAWEGRISGYQLGKPVEAMSIAQGHDALVDYLKKAEALPLRDYVPVIEGTLPAQSPAYCKGHLVRSEPDDDINYTVLALILLEEHESPRVYRRLFQLSLATVGGAC